MTICSAGHSGLYYPQDPAILAEEAEPMMGIEGSAPKALLLPHAAWSSCLPLLHRGLAHTRGLKTSLIVLLAPYHGAEKNLPLMLPASDALALGHTTIGFATVVRARLSALYPLAVDDAPFHDESSWELLMPLLASYHPGVPILPILAGQLTGEHRSRYAALLAEIDSRYPDALYIVTSNANEMLPSPKAEESAAAFLTFLKNPGIERHPAINACNRSALTALARQRWAAGRAWKPIARMCDGTAYDEIPPSLGVEERHVWHITALMEES